MPSETTTLLLVRHGQSTWNAEGRWQGQANPPLTELGREQARLASQRIGTVDVIVASPQDRAATTAAIIAEALGVGPMILHEGLRERFVGPWSGMTRSDIEAEYPGWLDEDRRPDEFESDASLLERVEHALREVVDQNPGATVLVLCHGGVIHNFELAHGITDGRLPNLSGRVVSLAAGQSEWVFGDSIRLLDDDQLTGGERHRV